MTDPARGTDGLTPSAYAALHEVAGALMRGERSDHTLQPTALVHEAYLRLRHSPAPVDEGAFRALAAATMRRILVDHARARAAQKRGGDRIRIALPEVSVDAPEPVELLALDDALRALAELDERASRVVELRFFGGLSGEETARALGIAPSTADADWALARAWLRRRLEGGGA